jgi:hypothetical protein
MVPSKRLFEILSLSCLCLALLIAHSPHYLLRVPKIGFVLYHMAGGFIPGYFDPRIFSYEHLWKREGDVIVSTCTKCGTTWLLQTAHHMRFKGRTPEFNDLHTETPWLELVYYPGQPMEERINILKRSHEKSAISVFKTHFQPPILSLRDDAKYLVGVRSIIDVAASLRQFFPNHDVHFARMWGGFPVVAGQPPGGDDAEQIYEHMFLKDVGNGRSMVDVLDLDLIKGWWPYRNRTNVMFVHYLDRIKDHRGSLRRIANFLGIQMTHNEFEVVAEKTSFASMKAESHKYDFGCLFDEFRARNLIPPEMKSITKDLVNTGPKRSGKDELSPKFVENIKRKVERDFGPAIAKYLLEGGDLPAEAELPPASS